MDSREIIRTDSLKLDDIPSDTASWEEFSIFALTFDPMLELGTTDIYKSEFIEFSEGSTLQELRRSLFLWQRALNWRSRAVDENDLQIFRHIFALMREKIRDQAH